MQPPNPQRPRPAGQQPDNNNGQQPDQRRRLLRRLLLWLPLLLIIVGPLVFQFLQGDGQQTRIIYSEFRRQVEAENVESVTVSGQEATGTLREPAQTEDTDGETTEYTEFATTLPEGSTEELFEQLNAQNVNIEVVPQNDFNFLNLLVNLLPFLLIFGLLFFLFRRSQAQGQQIFQIGQSKAKLYDRTSEATTFEDVAGQAGAKRELEEVVDFLSEPERFERLGGEIPRGVLLVGPPGTGKTLLARAVAGEAGVPFFSITGSDFMEMFVGVGASRVRDLFGEAKKVAPSIIFIDELDSIGRRRGAGLGGGHDEREQTLNQILSELDGFEESRNVIVIAATNRPDILDPALLRPGRFDRQITVDLPTKQDRTAILKIHARGKPLAPDLDLERVAAGTPGFSGADLQNLLNEAALLAARKDKDAIDQTDIEEARDKIILGLERESLALSDEELRLVAYHEAGHALVAAMMPHADPIHKVTIVPRGRAMGVTQQVPTEEKYLYRREYMLDRMAVMMGGRAAESLVFETATSGAENDFKQATRLARKMVLDWGMSERLGPMALGGQDQEVFLGEELATRRQYSEQTAREVDKEVRAILEEAYNRAMDTLRTYRDRLDAIADALIEHEELPGEHVLSMVG